MDFLSYSLANLSIFSIALTFWKSVGSTALFYCFLTLMTGAFGCSAFFTATF